MDGKVVPGYLASSSSYRLNCEEDRVRVLNIHLSTYMQICIYALNPHICKIMISLLCVLGYIPISERSTHRVPFNTVKLNVWCLLACPLLVQLSLSYILHVSSKEHGVTYMGRQDSLSSLQP